MSEAINEPPEAGESAKADTPKAAYRTPSDYYSTPVTARPPFPRWVPMGCGGASILLLVILFAGGAIVGSGGGGGGLLRWLFESMRGEMTPIMTKDVTPEQKAAFNREFDALESNLSAGKVGLTKVQPILEAIRTASADQKLTPAEVSALTRQIHELNTSAKGSAESHR